MKYILLFMLVFLSSILSAQVTYVMQNASVTDCEGILTDSDMGEEEGQYAHEEDYTFTICVDGADEIIVVFNFFASEAGYDILTVYDGPNINSPVIATLSGILQPAPTLIATSGCITFRFISDDNIAAIGWSANWTTNITTPPTPMMSLVGTPVCPLLDQVFRFDRPVPCDLIVPGNFTLLGPGGGAINTVIPLNCDPQTGMATEFRVTFNPPASVQGNYRLLFSADIEDACGRVHPVSSNVLFQLANCPMSVYIEFPDGPVCEGQCTAVRAVVSNGNPVGRTFQWSHSPVNAAQTQICAVSPTLISVTVTDNPGGQTATAQITYTPLEIPVILNPLQDTFCASRSNHTFQVDLPGGEFYSYTIPDHHRTTGVYEFWRLAGGNNLRIDTMTYVAPNGCFVRDTIYVLPIDARADEGACTGSAPFQVLNATPAGGTWSGDPRITPGGLFTPDMQGNFLLIYTAPNGCTDRKRVFVADAINMPDIDTVCSTRALNLEATPFGGRWAGPGIVNAGNGRLEAWRANLNQINTYTYTINGCTQTMDIYILDLWAGDDRAVCLSENTLTLPYPGNWTGPGVFDPITNTFDISGLGVGDFTYVISLEGCSDDFILYRRETRISADAMPSFCPTDTYIELDNHISWDPGSGNFSGNMVSWSNDEWIFNPQAAGSGFHWIYYDWLGCVDSIEVFVESPAVIPDLSFCDRNAPVILSAQPAGGTWEGPGFLDTDIGLFDPQLLNVGSYNITYWAPSGCPTSAPVEIFMFEQVSISGILQQYCQKDTVYQLVINPVDGDFFINSVTAIPAINPSVLGAGVHELYYTKGTGACASSDRKFITVLEPIALELALVSDSICSGQQAVVEALAQGGKGNLTYIWNQGLGFGNSQIVSPNQSTWYTVQISDQCSDPLIDSMQVFVYPDFQVNQINGADVCYGDSTFAKVIFANPDDYEVTWLTNPVFVGDSLYGLPGAYNVEILERSSGCKQRAEIILPGAGPLTANFALNPNQDCIDIVNNTLEILNLAVGYSMGEMDFGDGSSPLDMIQNNYLAHDYRDTGYFTVTQYISNDLGCRDTFSLNICVKNVARLFVPNAFSPNGDERNDLLQIYSIGISDVHWRIYNRYGALIFESFELTSGWDGTFKGQVLDPDVFTCVVQYTDRGNGLRTQYVTDVVLMK